MARPEGVASKLCCPNGTAVRSSPCRWGEFLDAVPPRPLLSSAAQSDCPLGFLDRCDYEPSFPAVWEVAWCVTITPGA